MAKRRKRATSAGITQAIVAGATGTAYCVAFEAAAKRIPILNKNYFASKGGIAAVIGAALAYLSKNPNVQAAGYGLIGVAGNYAGNAIANKLPMNGTNRVTPLNGLKEAVRRRRMLNASTSTNSALINRNPYPIMDDTLYLS
jgi:hypothetical protein